MKVKVFADGSFLEYAPGKFDDWCVYMVNPQKGFRSPPRDTHYFDFLLQNAERFGADKIYRDFVGIYENTGTEIVQDVLTLIERIALTYTGKELEFEKILTIMYMGMIAEEKKLFTRLGKRIKRLGVHMLLQEGAGVDHSANFMRGLRWREIDRMCQERGF